MEDPSLLHCSHEGCTYATKKQNTLKKHERRHLPKAFMCESCPYTCHTRADMEIHVHRHTGEKPFSCPREGCPYRARKSSSIGEHLRTHVKVEKTLFVCTLCPREFLGQASLDSHYKRIHLDGTFHCEAEGCGFQGASASKLRAHCKKEHSSVDLPVKACAHCSFSTNSARLMDLHVTANHGGDGLLQLFDGPFLAPPAPHRDK